MRLSILSSVVMVLGLSAACGPKAPSAGDARTNASNANASASSTAGASGSDSNPATEKTEGPDQGTTGLEPPSGATQSRETKLPSFVDPKSGEIKDLPSFPAARRTNVMFGPIQGVDTAMLVLQTATPIEKVAEYYEKAVKKNRWKVVSSMSDPEIYKWELKKGDRDEALVQVKKDSNGMISIVLSRLEKPPQPKQ